MDDIAEKAEAFFIIGSNTTEQHPVFGTKLRRAIQKRGAKLIVADPRRIDITDLATVHLQQKAGTDTALINGLSYLIEKMMGQRLYAHVNLTKGERSELADLAGSLL